MDKQSKGRQAGQMKSLARVLQGRPAVVQPAPVKQGVRTAMPMQDSLRTERPKIYGA